MKRNMTVAVGALCLAAAGWAVAYAQDRQPAPSQGTGRTPSGQMGGQTGAQRSSMEVCPVGIQGLEVQAVTIPEGGALQFVAASEAVPELRSRMQRFARMHREQMQQHRPGATGGGATGGGATGGATGGGATGGAAGTTAAQPHFADTSALIHQAREIRVVEIPNGVRLEVRIPEAQLEGLRNELRQDAQQLSQGRCPLALQIEA